MFYVIYICHSLLFCWFAFCLSLSLCLVIAFCNKNEDENSMNCNMWKCCIHLCRQYCCTRFLHDNGASADRAGMGQCSPQPRRHGATEGFLPILGKWTSACCSVGNTEQGKVFQLWISGLVGKWTSVCCSLGDREPQKVFHQLWVSGPVFTAALETWSNKVFCPH